MRSIAAQKDGIRAGELCQPAIQVTLGPQEVAAAAELAEPSGPLAEHLRGTPTLYSQR